MNQTEDCTDQLKAAREENEHLRHLLGVDYVTGLPLRRVLERDVSTRLDNTNPGVGAGTFALGVVRLDERYRRRPMSSDLAGVLMYAVGQRLLELAPDRVYQSWRTDEFVIVIDDGDRLNALSEMGAEIQAAVGQPLQASGMNIRLGCHIGFAVFPQHGETVPDLLGNAEIALGVVEQRRSRM